MHYQVAQRPRQLTKLVAERAAKQAGSRVSPLIKIVLAAKQRAPERALVQYRLPERLKAHVQFIRFDRDIAVFWATSAAWAMRLKQHEPQILDSILADTTRACRGIRVRVVPDLYVDQAVPTPRRNEFNRTLSPHAKRQLEAAVAVVSDDNLA